MLSIIMRWGIREYSGVSIPRKRMGSSSRHWLSLLMVRIGRLLASDSEFSLVNLF